MDKNLAASRYTLALLQEGFRVGLLDKQALAGLQAQIMLLLKDLILRYTRGESTSVTVETAESIMHSIFYSLDAYLRSFNNPQEGLAILQATSVKEIYAKGLALVTACVAECKTLYRQILKQKLNVQLEAYNTMLEEDLPMFFKNYGAVFKAHDTMATFDYPLVFDDMSSQGIFYIKQYLEKLETETRFCRLFAHEDMERILVNYGRICRIDYRKWLLNIFELLIDTSVFAVLSGCHAGDITITQTQYGRLQARLSRLKASAIDPLVDGAMAKVCQDLQIEEPKLLDYLHQYRRILKLKIAGAVEKNTLQHLIITAGEEKIAPHSMIFRQGERMSDDGFRSLIRSILNREATADKIKLITARVHSLEDLLDVLEANCLFGEEFASLYNALSDPELAVLGTTIFNEELRNGPLPLSSLIAKAGEAEIEWQARYLSFIQKLHNTRTGAIEKMVNTTTCPALEG